MTGYLAVTDRCPWVIRWGTTAEATTRCDKEPHGLAGQHTGPGLLPGQRITWLPGDRREYRGDWPGYCQRLALPAFQGGCTLPAGHHGRCAP